MNYTNLNLVDKSRALILFCFHVSGVDALTKEQYLYCSNVLLYENPFYTKENKGFYTPVAIIEKAKLNFPKKGAEKAIYNLQ